MCKRHKGVGGRLRCQLCSKPGNNEWIGIFEPPRSTSRFFKEARPRILSSPVNRKLLNSVAGTSCFSSWKNLVLLVCLPSGIPSEILPVWGWKGLNIKHFFGFATRVRIQNVIKGPKKKNILLYYGKIKDWDWDPVRFK